MLVARWIRSSSLGDIAHVQDECAYLLQAKTFLLGWLSSAPLLPRGAFNMWFVEDRFARFGIFPPGWPLVLAGFVRLGLINWANPILHGLAVPLLARASRELTTKTGGLIAALLFASSPQALLLASSLMSHGIVVLASAAIVAVVIDVLADRVPSWRRSAIAATLLALVVTTRPLCAAVLMLLVGAAVAWKAWQRAALPYARLSAVGGGALAGVVAFALYNQRLTGSATYAPQSMYFDTHLPPANTPYFNYHLDCNALGFGPTHGCDFSIAGSAHTLYNAALNTGDNLRSWALLLGGGPIVLLLAAVAIVVLRGALPRLLWAGIVVTIGAYALYWYAGTCFGARFYHVAVPFVVLLASGVLMKLGSRWPRVMFAAVAGIFLVNAAVVRASAREISDNYWGVDSRFATLKKNWTKGPAVVMIAFDRTELPDPEAPKFFWTTEILSHGFWMPDACANSALSLNDPVLGDEVVFVRFHPALLDAIRERLPNRELYLYTATRDARKDTFRPWNPAAIPPATVWLFPPDNFEAFDVARAVERRAEAVPSLETP